MPPRVSVFKLAEEQLKLQQQQGFQIALTANIYRRYYQRTVQQAPGVNAGPKSRASETRVDTEPVVLMVVIRLIMYTTIHIVRLLLLSAKLMVCNI